MLPAAPPDRCDLNRQNTPTHTLSEKGRPLSRDLQGFPVYEVLQQEDVHPSICPLNHLDGTSCENHQRIIHSCFTCSVMFFFSYLTSCQDGKAPACVL